MNKRSTYVYDVNLEGDKVHTEKSFTGLSCYVSWRNILTKGLSAGLGVYDAFNQKLNYISAYYTELSPQPAQSREFLFNLRYEFDVKK
jgi:hypothetical protein